MTIFQTMAYQIEIAENPAPLKGYWVCLRQGGYYRLCRPNTTNVIIDKKVKSINYFHILYTILVNDQLFDQLFFYSCVNVVYKFTLKLVRLYDSFNS